MKTALPLLAVAAPAFSTTAIAADDPWPKDSGGTRPKEYPFGVDATVQRDGQPAAFIMSLTDDQSPSLPDTGPLDTARALPGESEDFDLQTQTQ